MANTYRGSGIMWGAGLATATLTGSGAITLPQSQEQTQDADEEVIRDTNGAITTVVKYNHFRKATLEFVPSSGTNAATHTISAWPSAGDTLTVVDAAYGPGAGTWLVDNVTITRSNTGYARMRAAVSRYTENAIPS